ncbi:Hypp6047 [Branchiostoma lanceolatum]|uniref:Hypp6047 protein n=1 Tax=Branchiostoma lanceolatum TaxID=7740 RepID=A0A8J9W615_BRALA|nr:Hypp6047 [Branchiostoma lanceolatum]
MLDTAASCDSASPVTSIKRLAATGASQQTRKEGFQYLPGPVIQDVTPRPSSRTCDKCLDVLYSEAPPSLKVPCDNIQYITKPRIYKEKRKLTSLSSFQDRIDAIKPGSATSMFMVGFILGERLSDECTISTVTSRKTGARVYALQEDMAMLSIS